MYLKIEITDENVEKNHRITQKGCEFNRIRKFFNKKEGLFTL